MALVYLAASNVAALLGRHSYRPKEQALLQTLHAQKGRPLRALQEQLWADLGVRVHLHHIDAQHVAQNFPAAQVPDLDTSASFWQSVKDDLLAASKKRRLTEEAVPGSVALGEEAILDDAVRGEEQRLRFLGDGYMLEGRLEDGVKSHDGRVVEVKTRRNWFPRPPEYDLIQLRVYLRLSGAKEGGVLEERSQRDPELRRTTVVSCDDSQWEEILQGLKEAARELREATLDDARRWAEVLERQQQQ